MIVAKIDKLYIISVTVNGEPLPMSDLAKAKSPSGFSWGYHGSGPAALAHSILTHLYDTLVADSFFNLFKAGILSRFPQDVGFELSEEYISTWLKTQLHEITSAHVIDDNMIHVAAKIHGLNTGDVLKAYKAIQYASDKFDAILAYKDAHNWQMYRRAAITALLKVTPVPEGEIEYLTTDSMWAKLFNALGLTVEDAAAEGNTLTRSYNSDGLPEVDEVDDYPKISNGDTPF